MDYLVGQWRRVVIHAIEERRLPERDLLKCIRLAEVAQASDGALRGKLGWFGHRQLMIVLGVSTNTADAFLDRLGRVGLLECKLGGDGLVAERRLAIPAGWEPDAGFLLRPKGVSVSNSATETVATTASGPEVSQSPTPKMRRGVSQFRPGGVSVSNSAGEIPSVERSVEGAVDGLNVVALETGAAGEPQPDEEQELHLKVREVDDPDAEDQLDAAPLAELTLANLDDDREDEDGTNGDEAAIKPKVVRSSIVIYEGRRHRVKFGMDNRENTLVDMTDPSNQIRITSAELSDLEVAWSPEIEAAS